MQCLYADQSNQLNISKLYYIILDPKVDSDWNGGTRI